MGGGNYCLGFPFPLALVPLPFFLVILSSHFLSGSWTFDGIVTSKQGEREPSRRYCYHNLPTMGLREILKKKDRIEDDNDEPVSAATREDTVNRLQAPEFTFIRSDTHTQEVIHPPSDPNDYHGSHEDLNYLSANDATHYQQQPPVTSSNGNGGGAATTRSNRLSEAFRSTRSSRGSSVSSKHGGGVLTPEKGPSPARRLSQRLHLSRSPASSENVPANLPEIVTTTASDDPSIAEEVQWEKRATILAETAGKNEALQRSRETSPLPSPVLGSPLSASSSMQGSFASMRIVDENERADPKNGIASTPVIDTNIQEAIRLHESGELDQSTKLFGILADPNGANNPLSQVLYGLALRHGWGCQPDPEKAVFYLSSAAKNAADVESLALQAGLKKGGAAKGELVLAIFELANCFRHGWGIEKDPIAAKQVRYVCSDSGPQGFCRWDIGSAKGRGMITITNSVSVLHSITKQLRTLEIPVSL